LRTASKDLFISVLHPGWKVRLDKIFPNGCATEPADLPVGGSGEAIARRTVRGARQYLRRQAQVIPAISALHL